jgi:Protein of unknown function (DUF1236)
MKPHITRLFCTAALVLGLSLTGAYAQQNPDKGGPVAGPQTGGSPGAGGGGEGAATTMPKMGEEQPAGAESDQSKKPAKPQAAEKPEQPKKQEGTAAEKTDQAGGKAAAGSASGKASAKIEPQQAQKVKTYFREHKPSVKRVERSAVSVSIGIALPASIALYPVPADVVVVSGGCPLQYFVWGDDIVLVDSCSRHVVEILEGAA